MVFSMIAESLGVSEEMTMMLSQLLVGVGAVNWGLIGITPLLGMDPVNLVEILLGTGMLANLVYTLVGLAGIDVLGELLEVY